MFETWNWSKIIFSANFSPWKCRKIEIVNEISRLAYDVRISLAALSGRRVNSLWLLCHKIEDMSEHYYLHNSVNVVIEWMCWCLPSAGIDTGNMFIKFDLLLFFASLIRGFIKPTFLLNVLDNIENSIYLAEGKTFQIHSPQKYLRLRLVKTTPHFRLYGRFDAMFTTDWEKQS